MTAANKGDELLGNFGESNMGVKIGSQKMILTQVLQLKVDKHSRSVLKAVCKGYRGRQNMQENCM